MGLTLFFCEFSLFVNIKYLHNIRVIAQSSILNLFRLHGEAYRQSFVNFPANFQPKFNGLVLGLWPTFHQTSMKIGAILFEISWRQTNKHLNFPINRKQHTCNRQLLFLEGRFKIIYWTFICFFLPIRDE